MIGLFRKRGVGSKRLLRIQWLTHQVPVLDEQTPALAAGAHRARPL